MGRLPWKKGKVFAVEARPGVWAVGQMLLDPYVAFFDRFCKDPSGEGIDLAECDVLFVCAVTRGFISLSNTVRVPVAPREVVIPTRWIDASLEDIKEVVLWRGTSRERRFCMFDGARLVEEDVVRRPDVLRELVPRIGKGDMALIDAHELTNVRSEGELYERLYLCHALGRNVDPLKDLILGRRIPRAYERYVDAFLS